MLALGWTSLQKWVRVFSNVRCTQREIFELVKHLTRSAEAKERLVKRFVKKLVAIDGCLIYTGKAETNNGYPYATFYWPQEGRDAHCKAYIHHVFACLKRCSPCSEGFEVDHACDTRRCVAHLVDRTSEENKARRKHATGSQQAKHPNWRKRQTGGRQSLPG